MSDTHLVVPAISGKNILFRTGKNKSQHQQWRNIFLKNKHFKLIINIGREEERGEAHMIFIIIYILNMKSIFTA